MKLGQYIAVFGTGTAIAWIAWLIVLLNIDPITSGVPALVIFFVTLFAGLVGLFTTIGTLLRAYRFKKRDLEDIVTTSLRQAFFLAILLEGVLFLMSQNALSIWVLLILIIALGSIEFVVLTKKHGKRRHLHD